MGTDAHDQTDQERRRADRRVAADPHYAGAERRVAARRREPRPLA